MLKQGKKTAGILYSGREIIDGSNTLQIDHLLRRNLGASIDDIVQIRKIEAKTAEKIIFTGLDEAVILKDSQLIAKKFINMVINKDYIFSFYCKDHIIDLFITN